MQAKDIIALARNIKKSWQTNDPYEIAERFGIVILEREPEIKDFKAHTMKFPGYPTVITINSNYSLYARKVLCAHELGHALLHNECVNHFAVTSENAATNVELEANLFAVALLTDDSIDRKLAMPLASMNNYLLKEILEFNIGL